LSGIRSATERSSERERTLVLAILATQPQPSRLVLRPKSTSIRLSGYRLKVAGGLIHEYDDAL